MPNITLNGLRLPIPEKMTINKLVKYFFNFNSELIVNKNSKIIPKSNYKKCKINNNDILQVISYPK